MLIGYWDFGHLDSTRLFRMGWKEDMDTEEQMGFPNKMAWFACVQFFFNFLLCIFVQFKDAIFMRAFQTKHFQIDNQPRTTSQICGVNAVSVVE